MPGAVPRASRLSALVVCPCFAGEGTESEGACDTPATRVGGAWRQDAKPDGQARLCSTWQWRQSWELGPRTHLPEPVPPCPALCSWPTWGAWAPSLQTGAWQWGISVCQGCSGRAGSGAQGQRAFVCLQMGRQAGAVWPSPGPAGCKLIRRLLRLPRRREQLETQPEAGSGRHTVRAAEPCCPPAWRSFLGGSCRVCLQEGHGSFVFTG